MPTYEYRCTKCKKTFKRDERISVHGSHEVHCPRCKSDRVEQILGVFFAKTSKKS